MVAPYHADDDRLEQAVRGLRFNSPRRYAADDVDGNGDGGAGVMVSCASFPDRSRLEVALPGAEIVSRVEGAADSATYVLTLAAASGQTTQFLDVDAALQDHAAELVHRWFKGTDPRLVEDGYRASTVVRKGRGVCLRLLMATAEAEVAAPPADVPCTVTLRLVGMYFRRQSYAAIWRLVDIVPTPAPETETETRPREEQRQQQRYRFVSDSDSDGGDDADGKGEDVALPTWDEFETMREAALRMLDERREGLRRALDVLDLAKERLNAAPNQDIAALEAAAASDEDAVAAAGFPALVE